VEAEILEWHCSEGNSIEEDDSLVDIETDKAIVEIPSPCTGTLKEIVVQSGTFANVGDVIAIFETDSQAHLERLETGVDSGENELKVEGENELDDPGQGIAGDSEGKRGDGVRTFAAPSTRRFAREQGVELSEVVGTAQNGRVSRNDIERYLQERDDKSESDRDRDHDADVAIDNSSRGDGREIIEPLRGTRRTIAENMQQSRQEIPHVTSGFEADATELVKLKKRLNDKHEEIRITYTAILIKAVVPALKEYPLVNASVDMETGEITKHQYCNIGIATHTEDGLIVPVIKNVDNKSLIEVAEVLSEKVDSARQRNIAPSELHDGTFTITNTGSHGSHGTFGTPIIRHPEAAILGVGAIKEKPMASEGEVVIQEKIGFSFSYDHRLIDGVVAGQFMECVIEALEDSDMLLSRL
jgi:pyruvate dehydrogenase E2 component (dihydrolipoamide acetyltransferase)